MVPRFQKRYLLDVLISLKSFTATKNNMGIKTRNSIDSIWYSSLVTTNLSIPFLLITKTKFITFLGLHPDNMIDDQKHFRQVVGDLETG